MMLNRRCLAMMTNGIVSGRLSNGLPAGSEGAENDGARARCGRSCDKHAGHPVLLLLSNATDLMTATASNAALASLVGRAVGKIGTFDFYVHLLDVIAAGIAFERAQVMFYPRHGAPRYLFTRQTPKDEQELYLVSYELDPLWRTMFATGAQDIVHLRSVCADHELTGPYFAAFFGKTGMSDELAFLLPTLGGGVVGLFVQSSRIFTPRQMAEARSLQSLFAPLHALQDKISILGVRAGASGDLYNRSFVILDAQGTEVFRSPEFARMQITYPGLGSTIMQLALKPSGSQVRLPEGTLQIQDLGDGFLSSQKGRICTYHAYTAPSSAPELADAISSFTLFYRLSVRQSQILRLALKGLSSDQIAKSLGLTEGTVRNHRKRLHDKMDVTSEREIFSLFLRFLGG